MKVSFEKIIPAPINKILDVYKDSEFYSQKQKASGAVSVEILEEELMADGKYRMKATVTEPSRLPGFLRQSDVDTYTDDTLLDPSSGVMTWTVTPSILPDKFLLSGKIEFFVQGNSTRIIYSTEMRVKVPFIGKKAEKLGLSKTEEEVNKQAEFLKKWLEKTNEQ